MRPFTASLLLATLATASVSAMATPPDGTPASNPQPAATITPKPVGAQALPTKPWLWPILDQSYQGWRDSFVMPDGRVYAKHWTKYTKVREEGSAITEGQSYAMMMAVFMNDRPTFDRVWAWTKTHMQVRPTDKLFAWWWGKRQDGVMGLINGDYAVDGDEDIAFALLMAAERWQTPAYAQEALPIIQDLWKETVVQIGDRYYITGGPWSKQPSHIALNPSYFAPYAYEVFAKVDPGHPWEKLAFDSFYALDQCSALNKANMPPEWCGVNRQGQFIRVPGMPDSKLNFEHEAVRVFWRMGLNRAFGNKTKPMADAYLKKHDALLRLFAEKNKIPDTFEVTGFPKMAPNNVAYSPRNAAALLMQNHIVQKYPSQELYMRTLGQNFQPAVKLWDNKGDYYGNSILWFSLYGMLY
jgi:endo-1,4-beta-D-glucanase Y